MIPNKKPEPFWMATASLPARVTQWLADHPEEWLTVHDVSVKFGAPRNQVVPGLRRAVAAGVLTAKANPKDTRTPPERVYQIGTTDWIIESSPADCETDDKPIATVWRNAANEPTNISPISPAKRPASPPAAPKKTSILVARPTPAELAALRAETGVPLVGRSKAEADPPKWQGVFDLLTQPGTSVAFPIAWKTGVTAYAVKLHRHLGKRTYHVRSISREQARIWRTA